MPELITPKSDQYLPFTYTVPIVLAANGTGTQVLRLGGDSWFQLHGFTANTDQDAALFANTQGQVPDNFKVKIKDVTTGRDLMTDPLFRGMILGKSMNYWFPEQIAVRFPPNNQFQFDFTNIVGVQVTVLLGLKGYKVFGQRP